MTKVKKDKTVIIFSSFDAWLYEPYNEEIFERERKNQKVMRGRNLEGTIITNANAG